MPSELRKIIFERSELYDAVVAYNLRSKNKLPVGELNATHQDLASELGSVREVISRHLKEFQRRGWIDLSRGRIALVERAAIARLAASD